MVVNEVKQLARETAQATDQIVERIESIRREAGLAVTSIRCISQVVGEADEMSAAIAATVEEQSTITSRIGEFAAVAASGSVSVADKMTEIATVAQSAKARAVDTQTAAVSLAGMAVELQKLVCRFKID